MRLWCGLAAVIVLALAVMFSREKVQSGAYLVTLIHVPLAVMLLTLASVTTADAISRERREGTLGLLFLTPLTVRQIVMGKFASRLVRLLYLWLLFVPLLMLPMLTGGLALDEFFLSVSILFCLLVTSVAAGMIASAVSISFASAVLRALFLGAIANVLIVAAAANLPDL